jgi:hypothetical protein
LRTRARTRGYFKPNGCSGRARETGTSYIEVIVSAARNPPPTNRVTPWATVGEVIGPPRGATRSPSSSRPSTRTDDEAAATPRQWRLAMHRYEALRCAGLARCLAAVVLLALPIIGPVACKTDIVAPFEVGTYCREACGPPLNLMGSNGPFTVDPSKNCIADFSALQQTAMETGCTTALSAFFGCLESSMPTDCSLPPVTMCADGWSALDVCLSSNVGQTACGQALAKDIACGIEECGASVDEECLSVDRCMAGCVLVAACEEIGSTLDGPYKTCVCRCDPGNTVCSL